MSDKATILVVDDDETILANVADMLRIAGYRLLMARDGSKGLQVLEYHTPDLIISDIAMPGMDGYQFYEAVRSNPAWTRIPFVFLTARGEQQDIRQGYQLGADHYLTKPFEPEDLLITVESRLKRAAEVQAVASQELVQTREQLTEVFRSELQEPLHSMYSYLSMLEEGQRRMTDDVVGRMLRSTRIRAEHVIRVVEDLMLLAQIDSGLVRLEVETQRKRTDVGQLLESVIRDLRPRAEAKNISLAYTQGDFSVLGVASYIQDLLTRLIDNAIKFGTYEGHVQVKIEEADNRVAVVVQDDGIGIEPDQLVDLYDPRARTNREDLGNGHVGLGLAIAKGLVMAHGGDIEVESRSGEGTRFTVTLPTT